jgi:hypothetical protein
MQLALHREAARRPERGDRETRADLTRRRLSPMKQIALEVRELTAVGTLRSTSSAN